MKLARHRQGSPAALAKTVWQPKLVVALVDLALTLWSFGAGALPVGRFGRYHDSAVHVPLSSNSQGSFRPLCPGTSSLPFSASGEVP